MKLRTFVPFGSRQGESALSEVQPLSFLHREIDRLFDDVTRGWPLFPSEKLLPRMDVVETDRTIEVTAELPGLEEKDVDVSLTDNVLTIRGEKKSQREEKDKDYRLTERSFGSFYRSIDLPDGIEPSSVQATLSKGILKVTVSKPPRSAAKKIDVKTG